MDGFLDNENKKINKNGCVTYGSYSRLIGDGGDATVVKLFCSDADQGITHTYSLETSTLTTVTFEYYSTSDIIAVTLQVKDDNSDNIVVGGEVVVFNTDKGILTSVIDVGDGTYTADLDVDGNTTNITLTALINGDAVTHSYLLEASFP